MERMRAPLLLSLSLCAVLSADTYPRQPGIDVQHYLFRISLSDETDEIAGETTVTIRFVQEGVTRVALDLGSAMTVSDVGTDRFRREADRLLIDLNSAPKAGEMRQFSIKYHGKPAFGLKISTNNYGERCFFSANWPDLAHHWLPTIDHPYDKATGEFIVTAPSRYQVVANGAIEEEIDLGDGRRVTHWNQRVPIATWLFNIGVAQFASRHFGAVAGVPLQTWIFRQDRDAGIATFEDATRRAVEFFSSHIGRYPYQKLADVQTAGNSGGMEHASAIFYGEKVVDGKPAYGLVAHETAHQWFGDSVTEKDWDDVWLSEGFATYFAALATEHYEGRDAFVASMLQSREQVYRTEKRMPGVAVVQDKPWQGIPNAIVYQKGGWVLHLLRAQVGTAGFWAGIREYYRRYRDSNASTGDFRKVMEDASGQDLGWFFRQWVYRAGSPIVAGSWTYDPAAKRLQVDLEQIQAGEAFRLPIEVAVGSRIERIEMTEKRQRFEIPAAETPASVTLDPNTWMLMEARFEKK
jgi:aminopeptidase N